MKKLFKAVLWIIIAFFVLSIGLTIVYRFCPVPVSPLMVIRLGQQFADGRPLKLAHRWVPLDSIHPSLPQAVWAAEDIHFFQHNGFDFDAIKYAIKLNRKKGRVVRGASTISQQTAKNVFLWPTSSWTRKAFEVYFTILIETFWSKHRIMEVYLNTIEMGDGIYGAEAVSLEHFGCHARDLDTNRSSLIAASLPNPIKRNSAHPSKYMYKYQRKILKQMRKLGQFPKAED
ncbi:MAG: monofunctional biosynthetic peptidoglycan transglycosylase [Bacteroidaceae bacterium]|nr:monofunctional biosynthetic peptidoglycan transglycosylase [Bacteroidaceae bacterium]